MIWKKLADYILKHRLLVLSVVGLLTVFMGYEAAKVRITFNGGKVLPVTDSSYIRYMQFKKTFGQDATVMVIGFKSDNIFDKDVFNDWYQIGSRLQHTQGITSVVSVANTFNLVKDTIGHKFVLQPLATHVLSTQGAVDSIKSTLFSLPFYKGLVVSNDGKSTLMAITFDGKIINSQARVPIINSVLNEGKKFEQKHHIQ